jgi:shikimate dehydrogenase
MGHAFSFEAIKVADVELAECILHARQQGIRGVSVTMPHKEAVIPFLDDIDDSARKVGAVNTIVNEGGKLTGFNTDCFGIVLPLRKHLKQRSKLSGVVLGAGGAARAGIVALQMCGISVTIVNRTIEKAALLAAEYGCTTARLGEPEVVTSADVIVNTTPSGMLGGESFDVSANTFSPGQIVFDAVYTPYWTPFLTSASHAGATCIHGIEMFIQQGGQQFEKYTGVKAPLEVMEQAVITALGIQK